MDYLKEMIEDLINENEDQAKVNFHTYLTGRMSNLTEGYADFYQGQVVIFNPNIDGTQGGIGIVDDVYEQNVVATNYKTKKQHSFSKSDVYDQDSDEAQKHITDDMEDVLVNM